MHSRTTSRRRCAAYAAASALTLALALAGCGSGGDDTSADPTTDPSVTESESEATTQTAATPSVAPATGPKLAVRGLRVNAPEGWEAKPRYSVMSAAFPVGVIGTTVYVFRFPNSGLVTFDGLARASWKMSGWKFRLKRLDDVVLDSQPAFHLAGKTNPGVYIERFGALLNDDRLTLTFEFLNGEDRATRDEIINSVLATVDFREVTQ